MYYSEGVVAVVVVVANSINCLKAFCIAMSCGVNSTAGYIKILHYLLKNTIF
jgi:hypothetical protein